MIKRITAVFFAMALIAHATLSGIAFADEYEAPEEVSVEYDEEPTLEEVESDEYEADEVSESEEAEVSESEEDNTDVADTDEEPAEGEEEEEYEVEEPEECDEEDEERDEVEAWDPEQEDALWDLIDDNRWVAEIASFLVLIANDIIEDEDEPQALKDSLAELVAEYVRLEAEFEAIIEEIENISITFEDARERLIANTTDFEELVFDLEEVLSLEADEWNAEQRAAFEALVARIEALILGLDEISTIIELIDSLAHPLISTLIHYFYEHDRIANYIFAFIDLIEDADGLDFEETIRVLEEFAIDLEAVTRSLRSVMRLVPGALESSYNRAQDHLVFLADLFIAAIGTRYNSRDDVVVINVRDCDFEMTVGTLYELRDNVPIALWEAITEYENIYFALRDGDATVEDVLAVAPGLSDEFDSIIQNIEALLGLTIECDPITNGSERPGGGGTPDGGDLSDDDAAGGGGGNNVLPETGVATSSTAIAGIALAGIGTAIFAIKKIKK